MTIRRGTGCFGAALVAVILVGVLAWAFRDDLLRRLGSSPKYTEVSPEAAASAEEKLRRLRVEGDTAYLSSVELASLLRYQVAEQFPELLQDPSVAMTGETLQVGGRVSTDLLPDLQELERLRPFLPDTTRIDLEGRMMTQQRGRVILEVESVSLAGVPIPQRYYPGVLSRLGRREEPGLPDNAIALALPDGIGSVQVRDGHLVMAP